MVAPRQGARVWVVIVNKNIVVNSDYFCANTQVNRLYFCYHTVIELVSAVNITRKGTRMAEKDRAGDAQDKAQNPLLSGRVKAETKDRFDAYKAWLKADDGGDPTYDDVINDLLNNSAAAKWGTTHPRTAQAVAHAQSLMSRTLAEFVSIADQVEVSEAEAEAKVKKQLEALAERVAELKAELDGADGEPGARARAAERDAIAEELREAQGMLSAAQEAAASWHEAADEAAAGEKAAKARLSEIQAENSDLVRRAMSAEAALRDQASQHEIEMLTARADADRALSDAAAAAREAAQRALDELRDKMAAEADAERQRASEALEALRGEVTSARASAAKAEAALDAERSRASGLAADLAAEREGRIGAQRDLALLQERHAAAEERHAAAEKRQEKAIADRDDEIRGLNEVIAKLEGAELEGKN